MYQAIIDKHHLIQLEEETHTYTLNQSNTDFQSVTEFISTFFQPFEEIKIARKLSQMSKYQHLSAQDILKDWENRRQHGTIVHKEIEDYLNAKQQDSKILEKKTQQAISFIEKKCINKYNLLFPEIKVCSEPLKIAGTIDLMIYNKKHNRLYLIDWKTNVKIKKNGYTNGIKYPANNIKDCSFNRYNLQLSIYQHILEKFYNAKVAGLYIMHLKNDSYEIMNCVFQKKYITQMLYDDKS